MLVDPRLLEREFDQRVDGERRQVAFIENDRIAKANRAVVVTLGAGNGEDLSRALAPLAKPADQCLTGDASGKRGMAHPRDFTSRPARGLEPRSPGRAADRGSCSGGAAWPRCKR